MICQPAIFIKGFPDTRVSSSVILVYGVTIRWLHFAHAQSNCTRPLDQKEVWPGDEATAYHGPLRVILEHVYKWDG